MEAQMGESNKSIEEQKEIQDYCTNVIVPIYRDFDGAHNVNHVQTVINQSEYLANERSTVDRILCRVIAAYHDVGLTVERERHEIFSAGMFLEDKFMEEHFTQAEREIMSQAIIDHRASSANPPKTVYGKIVSDADRNWKSIEVIRRVIIYTNPLYPDIKECAQHVYDHIKRKYMSDGYGKCYLPKPKFFWEKIQKWANKLTLDEVEWIVNHYRNSGMIVTSSKPYR
jgi:uncharacterized protein